MLQSESENKHSFVVMGKNSITIPTSIVGAVINNAQILTTEAIINRFTAGI